MKKTGTSFLKKDSLKLGLRWMIGHIARIERLHRNLAPFRFVQAGDACRLKLVFVIIYFARFTGYDFDEFIRVFFRENRLITFFGVWCLVGNIALFTYYINTNRDETSKGIFAISLLYGIGVLLLKLLN